MPVSRRSVIAPRPAAVSAHLGRYRGASRLHIKYDPQVFLHWCAGQNQDPLTTERADIERYVRWLQEVNRYRPSTVSRRLSVVVGFYRTCVIEQLLPHSPAATSAGRWCHPNHPPSGTAICNSKP
jgi:integrase/recombinase XerD